MAHGFDIQSRTIHTIFVTLPDDVLGQVEVDNDIEVIFQSRNGTSTVKKLTYRDVQSLLNPDIGRVGKQRLKHL